MTDPIKPYGHASRVQGKQETYDMTDPIKLPEFDKALEMCMLDADEQMAVRRYAHFAVEQNTAELRAELDILRDSNAAKADRLDRLGEQIVALRARVAELEAYASALNNGLEAAADNQRKYNKHDVDADV